MAKQSKEFGRRNSGVEVTHSRAESKATGHDGVKPPTKPTATDTRPQSLKGSK